MTPPESDKQSAAVTVDYEQEIISLQKQLAEKQNLIQSYQNRYSRLFNLYADLVEKYLENK